MSIRTPNPLTNRQTLLDLQRSKERAAVLGEQISSGNRIVRLADDPSGAAMILDFQNSINKNNQYVQQASTVESFLQVTESTLTALNESLTRLVELGPSASSTSTTAQGRASIATEVDGLRDAILSLSNTQQQGKYIFAGTQTLTKPFNGPSAGPITYSGDSNLINMNVTSTTTISSNLTGDHVFFGGPAGQGTAADLFQQVTDLRDALNANNTAGIQAAVANITTIRQRVLNDITDLGGRQNELTQVKSDLQAYNASLESIQSTYQAVDYPAAISKYSMEQTSQQAALSIIAKSGKTNLFDYLG